MSGELNGIGMVICFSISFVIIRRIESETTPLFNNTLRSIIGALSFVFISIAIGSLSTIFLLPVNLWILLCLSIFCNLVVGDTLYLYSQLAIGPSYTAAITTTFPIFTLLIEFFILKREIEWIMPVAAAITGIGVIIVMRYSENKFKKKRTNISTLKGIVFALGTSLIWAIGTILTDYSLKQSEEMLNLGTNITFVAYSIRYSFTAIIMST